MLYNSGMSSKGCGQSMPLGGTQQSAEVRNWHALLSWLLEHLGCKRAKDLVCVLLRVLPPNCWIVAEVRQQEILFMSRCCNYLAVFDVKQQRHVEVASVWAIMQLAGCKLFKVSSTLYVGQKLYLKHHNGVAGLRLIESLTLNNCCNLWEIK